MVRAMRAQNRKDPTVPMIQIHLIEGRAEEQKAQLAREVTEVVARVLGVSAERVQVLVNEYGRQNWSVGGAPVRNAGAAL